LTRSRIPVPDPHQRIEVFLTHSKIRSGVTGVLIPDPISRVWIFSIPDPGVKKVPDPGSGSAKLLSPAAFDKKQLK
jgi:hypothetical protein